MQTKRYTDTQRESIISVLGAPPELRDLEASIIEEIVLPDCVRWKVRYEVAIAEAPAIAHLFIPNDLNPPAPAIICQHRADWSQGKNDATDMALAFVGQGYIVLAPDMIGYGERRPHPNAGLDAQIQELGVRLVRGETLLRKAIWDISRGIDLLETLPGINIHAIGMIGQGFGALMTAWAAALDLRITAAVGHGGWTRIHGALARKEALTPEFIVPRLLQVADYEHVLGMVAPRPFLLSATPDDPTSLDFPLIAQKTASLYARVDDTDALAILETTDELWLAEAIAWLNRWLRSPKQDHA